MSAASQNGLTSEQVAELRAAGAAAVQPTRPLSDGQRSRLRVLLWGYRPPAAAATDAPKDEAAA